jgi:16S rRNA processing protein RimM
VGTVLSSHGVRGFFKVKSFSGETGHYHKFKNVYLQKDDKYEMFAVEKLQEMHGTLLMKVTGIDTPEMIKKYSGCEIWVHNKYANRLAKGEYYIKDLCQCSIFYENKKVGYVKAVYETGNADLLEVEGKDGTIFMIPFQEHFIGKVDTGIGRIELKKDEILQ